MHNGRLLMISIDRSIFVEGSQVRARMIEYGKQWEEVHIVVAADKNFTEMRIGDNVWVYPSRYFLKIFYPFGIMRLGRFIIERRKITHITCQDPFLTAMAGVVLKKEFGIPLEIQIHTDIGSPRFTYTWGNKIRKFLALNYIPGADSIRVVSERVRGYLVDVLKVDNSKIVVRPIVVDIESVKNGFVKDEYNLHQKYKQFGKIALIASRLESEKNITCALHAWRQVVRRVPGAGLIIVGNGKEEPKLKRQSSRLGIAENVVFEPWVDKRVLVSYYKTADVFINTSLYEGYGMTLVEAHAAGCPIISTDVGVARELGATIVGYDEYELAAAVITLFERS